jgi:membrane protein
MRASEPEPAQALAGRVLDWFPVRVIRKFVSDDGPNLATLVAWNGLLSLFPIALFVVAVGGLVLSFAGISSDQLARLVVQIFPSDSQAQKAALNAITGLRQATGVFAIAALIGFLWGASGLFGTMEHTFGVVFGTGGRSFVRQKLMSVGMMAIFVVLSLIAVAASSLVPLVNEGLNLNLSVPGSGGPLGIGVEAGVGGLAGFILFFAIYAVVPVRRYGLRVWPGALVAGLSFELLTQLFPLYIRLNPGINQFGRLFAFLFVLLAFFYFLGLITIIGAEVIEVANQRVVSGAGVGEEQVGGEGDEKADQDSQGHGLGAAEPAQNAEQFVDDVEERAGRQGQEKDERPLRDDVEADHRTQEGGTTADQAGHGQEAPARPLPG